MDVASLYTNMPQGQGIEFACEAYSGLRVVSNFRDSGKIHARVRKWAPARRRATRRGAEN